MNLLETARLVACRRYGLKKDVSISRITTGLVNASFKIEDGENWFVLQKLHPVFGRDGEAIENAARISERLLDAGVASPRVVPTLEGALWAAENGDWRMMTWMKGVHSDKSLKTIEKAAGFLGVFHRVLNERPIELKVLPEADYNREGLVPIETWKRVVEQYCGHEKFSHCEGLFRQCLGMVERMPGLDLTERAVVHGDPKIDNFLFNESGDVLCLIDLDTARTGSIVWELADALRSWTGVNDPSDGFTFNPEYYRVAVETYKSNGLSISEKGWSQAPFALRAIALNLALRYLKDYFEESYFIWNKEKYKSLAEQNLIRAKEMIELARRVDSVV